MSKRGWLTLFVGYGGAWRFFPCPPSSKVSVRRRTRDAIAEAQAPPAGAPAQLPQDRGDRFDAGKAEPSSSALDDPAGQGPGTGFDFSRDPLNAKQPMQTFDEIMKADVARQAEGDGRAAQAPGDAATTLTPKLDPEAKMSRGKPLPVGPTARLAAGRHLGQLWPS